MEKTGLNGYVYDFSVDYKAADVMLMIFKRFIDIWWRKILWYEKYIFKKQ